MNKHLTERDREAVAAFANFLSWGEKPSILASRVIVARRAVPPAWWAHVMGATSWCPPKGEM